jgi:hypothetical protein
VPVLERYCAGTFAASGSVVVFAFQAAARVFSICEYVICY